MSECIVCYESNHSYVIQCGSVVPHIICDKCEITMRMKEPITREGRILRCPVCSGIEKNQGNRSVYSYEVERVDIYKRLPHTLQQRLSWVASAIRLLPRDVQEGYVRMNVHLRAHLPDVRVKPRPTPCEGGCSSSPRLTTRQCSYEGCFSYVCRSCDSCMDH